MDPTNGWDKYQLMVLSTLERLENNQRTLISGNSAEHDAIQDRITEIKMEFAVHKVKTGIFGLIGGALGAITTLVVAYLKGMFALR